MATAPETAAEPPAETLSAAAVAVLSCPEPARKVALTQAAVSAWRAGRLAKLGSARPPNRPARPERPELRPPRDMPRRRLSRGRTGRIALLHALAHIELNALDLAWDMIARFATADLGRAFAEDWLAVAEEEARHFALLAERLGELGGAYGDLPAHDGLWQAAESTRDDLLARLAVVPLVLEARGLDVLPGLIARLEALDDQRSVAVLRVIYDEEIGHVGTGKHWFDTVCRKRGLAHEPTWQAYVRARFKGPLKPPFNEAARRVAGLEPALYAPMAEADDRQP